MTQATKVNLRIRPFYGVGNTKYDSIVALRVGHPMMNNTFENHTSKQHMELTHVEVQTRYTTQHICMARTLRTITDTKPYKHKDAGSRMTARAKT